jgi:hypothetical protein
MPPHPKAVKHKVAHVRNLADLINNDELAARGSGFIDLLLIVGIVVAILLVNIYGSIRLQVVGFIGCAVGLAIAACSSYFAGATQIAMIFVGFMVFNFMTNMGPNAQTYLIAGEVFPTKVRSMGAAFAAAFAKIGAVTTAFLLIMGSSRFLGFSGAPIAFKMSIKIVAACADPNGRSTSHVDWIVHDYFCP